MPVALAVIQPEIPQGFGVTQALLAIWVMVYVYKQLIEPRLKNGKAATGDQALSQIRDWTKDLHEWHKHEDPDRPGYKVWYTPAKLDENIARLRRDIAGYNSTAAMLAETLKAIQALLAAQSETMQEIGRKQDILMAKDLSA